jgi:hypothetical protein
MRPRFDGVNPTNKEHTMSSSRLKKSAVAAVAALSVAAGGTALAADGSSTTSPSAFLGAVAQKLGISTEKLQDATKAAAVDQVDAQLEAGMITQAQADAIKARIAAGNGFGLGGLGPGGPGGHRGPGGPGGHLADAATYLGLTEAKLLEQLRAGTTLAAVAKAQGKTVEGLKAALLTSEKKELAQAVTDGRLTQAQADEMLAAAGARFDDMIAGTLPQRGAGGRGGRAFGPPAATGSSSSTTTTGTSA